MRARVSGFVVAKRIEPAEAAGNGTAGVVTPRRLELTMCARVCTYIYVHVHDHGNAYVRIPHSATPLRCFYRSGLF